MFRKHVAIYSVKIRCVLTADVLSFKFTNTKGSIVSISAVMLKMSDSPIRSTLLTSHIPSYNKMTHILI